MPDVKGEDIFENKILALIWDIVFLVYSIIYTKAKLFVEYLFFELIFKVSAMQIGQRSKDLYEMSKDSP